MYSSLVSHVNISPNQSGVRKYEITRITPHCTSGHLSVVSLGEWFSHRSTAASSNYGIDDAGRIACYVEEECRSWCSSSGDNDNRAVTIECESDNFAPYRMSETVYNRLIDLCVDICKRYGKKKLLWLGSKEKTLSYVAKNDEMVLTVHKWFKNKDCPGEWLYSRLNGLANEVTSRLNGNECTQNENVTSFEPFKMRVSIDDLNIRSGPGTNYSIVGICPPGLYTCIGMKDGKGSKKGWCKLKSGAGWISYDYVKKET